MLSVSKQLWEIKDEFGKIYICSHSNKAFGSNSHSLAAKRKDRECQVHPGYKLYMQVSQEEKAGKVMWQSEEQLRNGRLYVGWIEKWE